MALLVEVMLVLFIIVIITVPVMKHAIRVDRIDAMDASLLNR